MRAVKGSKIKEILDADELTELVQKEPLVLVDFFASWCMPCRILANHLERIVEDLENHGIKVVKVETSRIDIESLVGGLLREPIRLIPTLCLFKNGVEIWRNVGTKARPDFYRELKEMILSATQRECEEI